MASLSAGPESAQYRESVRALQAIRGWRSLFVFLAVLAPLTHLGAWAFVRFVDTGRSVSLQTTSRHRGLVTSRPADEGAVSLTAKELLKQSSAAPQSSGWEDFVRRALPVTMTLMEFIGRCAVVLLAITLLLGALVVLHGGMPGVADVIRGFFVTVIVGFLVIPWERMSQHEEDAVMPGVFTTYDKLVDSSPGKSASPADELDDESSAVKVGNVTLGQKSQVDAVMDGIRFAALPLIAIIMLLTAGSRFGRAFRLATARPAAGGGIPLS